MAQGDADRIGGVGAELPVELQQGQHHQLHLLLLRPTLSDDRQLDLARRIFEDRRVRAERRAKGRASGLTELERAVGVAVHEHALDRDFGRPVLAHQFDTPSKICRNRGGNASPRCGWRRSPHSVADPPIQSMMPKPVACEPGSRPRMRTGAARGHLWWHGPSPAGTIEPGQETSARGRKRDGYDTVNRAAAAHLVGRAARGRREVCRSRHRVTVATRAPGTRSGAGSSVRPGRPPRCPGDRRDPGAPARRR